MQGFPRDASITLTKSYNLYIPIDKCDIVKTFKF